MGLRASQPRPILRACAVGISYKLAWVCQRALTTSAKSDKKCCEPVDSGHITSADASSADPPPPTTQGGGIEGLPLPEINRALFQHIPGAHVIGSASTLPGPQGTPSRTLPHFIVYVCVYAHTCVCSWCV